MDKEQFWALIEKCKRDADDVEEQVELIQKELIDYEISDIAAFQRHFDECLKEAYRWDLWAAAYIINGGCSDDGFDYFLGWLIAQGSDYFYGALEDPQSAGNAVRPGEFVECESLWYAPANAYEEKTGNDDFFTHCHPVEKELQGVPFDEENVHELYPDLAEKFASQFNAP